MPSCLPLRPPPGPTSQGLLGGFSLLNFFMTYMLYNSSDLLKFLSYYAPLAQNNNRIYYALLVLSVISSTSRRVPHTASRPLPAPPRCL